MALADTILTFAARASEFYFLESNEVGKQLCGNKSSMLLNGLGRHGRRDRLSPMLVLVSVLCVGNK